MKLLLINALNPNNFSETVFPSLGLAYIASYLRKFIEDIEIKIINSDGKNILTHTKNKLRPRNLL